MLALVGMLVIMYLCIQHPLPSLALPWHLVLLLTSCHAAHASRRTSALRQAAAGEKDGASTTVKYTFADIIRIVLLALASLQRQQAPLQLSRVSCRWRCRVQQPWQGRGEGLPSPFTAINSIPSYDFRCPGRLGQAFPFP